MNAALTTHAQEMIAKRGIPLAWVERAVDAPELERPDPIDPALVQRFVKIPEHDNRVQGGGQQLGLARAGGFGLL